MEINSLVQDMAKIENYLLRVKAEMLEAAESEEDLDEGCASDEEDEEDEGEDEGEEEESEDEEEEE
jgi:hypothetical protein